MQTRISSGSNCYAKYKGTRVRVNRPTKASLKFLFNYPSVESLLETLSDAFGDGALVLLGDGGRVRLGDVAVFVAIHGVPDLLG